jgi:myo-inositol catabolism protein IolS
MTDLAPRIRLGRTEARVSRISLGTWAYGGENMAGRAEIGWSGHDDAAAREALRRCHALGLNHWDTADVYGNGRSEELIGGMWGEIPRQDVFLATKVGWNPGEFKGFYHPELVAREIDASLRRLKTDVIDLYYLHHCDFGPGDARLDDALALVRKARDAGKIRFIGLSDWDDANIMRLIARVDPDVVQPYRNVTHDTFASSGLAAWCAEHDCGLAFFSPIRHGLLLGKYATPTRFPEGDFRNSDKGFRDTNLLARLTANAAALRDRFGDTPETVLGALCAAVLDDAPTACALLGQRNPAQVEAAARASQLRLSPDDLAWVRGLYAGLEGA